MRVLSARSLRPTWKAIDVGSKVIYAQAAGAAGLDSDVVLYTGPETAHSAMSRPRLRPFLAL
jgi:hypothetical protein